jgi:regulation of enolase protein 1 (concanavalin A-like superfamily)
MKRLLIVLITLYSVYNTTAQQLETLRIKTIPHPLRWENNPLSYSLKNDELVLVAGEKTDMFRDPNVTYNTDNAPKLVFKADENFVLSASIEHSFTNKWDGGAIILKSDALHWVKFCFEKDYTGANRVVSVVTKNVSDDCNSVAISGNKVFYKVAKAANVITLYYSINGLDWFLVRHLQFDATTGFEVGFLAQSPVGSKCEVRFSDIQYQSKKIKDPYLGE